MGDLIYLNTAVRHRHLSEGLVGLRNRLGHEQERSTGKQSKAVAALSAQLVEKIMDHVAKDWWEIIDPQADTCMIDRRAYAGLRTRVGEIGRGQKSDPFITVRRLSWDCSVEFPSCIPASEINQLVKNTSDIAQIPRGGLRPMLERVGDAIVGAGLVAYKIRYDLSRLYIEAFDRTDTWGPEASSYKITIDFTVLLNDIGTIREVVAARQG